MYKYQIFSYIKEHLDPNILSKSRLSHIKWCTKLMLSVSLEHHLDYSKVKLIGLAHDLARNEVILPQKDQIELEYCVNAYHGAIIANRLKTLFDISKDIYDSLYYHTLGKPKMNRYQLLLFLSDYADITRTFRKEARAARTLLYSNQASCAVYEIKQTKDHLKSLGLELASCSVKTMEYYKEINIKSHKRSY
jgi:HD superfamily phosphohydrolase YqeK